MDQSTELKELYLRSCEAQSKSNYAFFERHLSREDGVLAIGTEPPEWWAGYATIAKVFKAQLQETGGFEILADTPLAYRDGSVGWVAGQPTLKLAWRQEIPLRLTAVLQKEQDDRKIVQWHFSLGVSNEDAIGETLMTG